MKWLIRGYLVVLMGYTGWRTYDFMVNQLPNGYTGSLMALLFLFATEVGVFLWHEVSIKHTTTKEQSGISTGLTYLDLVASFFAGVADMIIRQTFTENIAVPDLLVLALIYGLPAAVVLNVLGGLLFLSNDADEKLGRAEREVIFEIHDEAIKEVRARKRGVAKQMVPVISQQLIDKVRGSVSVELLGESRPVDYNDISDPEPTRPNLLEQVKNIFRPSKNGYSKEPVKYFTETDGPAGDDGANFTDRRGLDN